jgi:hypothetical protein
MAGQASDVIRIAITAEAFDAIAATLPAGSAAFEPEAELTQPKPHDRSLSAVDDAVFFLGLPSALWCLRQRERHA